MSDIVQRLRDCENYEDAWQLKQEASDEIERLRQQLAEVTKTLDETVPWRELQAENKELRKQLAECERERDDHLRSWNRVVEERIAVTKERDEVVETVAHLKALLAIQLERAKLGADKTGEGS